MKLNRYASTAIAVIFGTILGVMLSCAADQSDPISEKDRTEYWRATAFVVSLEKQFSDIQQKLGKEAVAREAAMAKLLESCKKVKKIIQYDPVSGQPSCVADTANAAPKSPPAKK